MNCLMLVSLFDMDYLDEYGLSDDDIKAIDEGIEEANKFFSKASLKDFFIGESTESKCVEKYLDSL